MKSDFWKSVHHHFPAESYEDACMTAANLSAHTQANEHLDKKITNRHRDMTEE